MGMTRFPKLGALLGGAAMGAASPPVSAADDETGATLDVGKLEAVMAAEADDAAAKATAAANTRWHTVMTSDAGKRSPAAGARMLHTTNMAAADVIATLDDLSPAPAAAAPNAADAAADDAATQPLGRQVKQPGNAAGTDRSRLQSQSQQGGDRGASPDTGGGSMANSDGSNTAKEHRKKIAEQRNAQTVKAAGGEANVRGG